MGAPKPSVELAGRPLIAYPLEAVAAGGLEPVVVAKRESELPRVECPVVADAESSRHPAAGILAALGAADGGAAVVLACDMPFAPPSLIEVLARLDRPAAVPRIGGRLQPLLARYGPAAIPVLQAAVAEDRPLNEAVAALDPLVLEPEELARLGEPETMAVGAPR
jgi:molybdopterin-guanine dinucleotide biosynthesis protein A